MTEQEFLNKIFEQYQIAGNLLEGDGGYNIKRGLSHAVSGYVEDLFALYIAKKIGITNLQYLVDKTISFRPLLDLNRAVSFRPDLMILENNVMTHYFDLKTNLGWNRNLKDYLIKKNKFTKRLKTKDAWITFDKNNKQNVKIANNIKYQMVVISGWNINQDILSENLRLADELEHVSIHVLNAKNNLTGDFEINQVAFDEIHNSINNLIKA
tara:strand:- start:13161 stop:13793 length:633 start_codon:yes stop_codon:yes gene_type:complete